MPIIGIDLGTTNSVLSILEDQQPRTVQIDGSKLLPSAVSISGKTFTVGQVAKNMAILEPNNTILSVKRRMGEDIQLQIGDKQMRPEEVSALILKKIKAVAAAHFKLEDKADVQAVITVPAYFTEGQRDATKQAAELAGLKVERIINEPTAAALAFGLSQMDEAVYAVYDFGGGTFDVSIIESDEGLVEVLASTGNNQLGGDDLDELLADYIWTKFTEKNKLANATRTAKEDARLRRIAEHTKIKLSSETEVAIQESFFFQADAVNYHLEQEISRTDFENLIRPKVEETVAQLEKAIEEAELEAEELDGIILVGGSSRIPLVSELIETRLGIAPTLIDLPDEAVSHGATLQGAIIEGLNIDTVLIDITPHSLGIGALDEHSYDRMSMAAMFAFERKGEKLEPDMGAAVMIAKNTPVPAKKTNRFGAVSAFQEAFQIEVFQGEGDRFNDNKKIGEVKLEVENPVEHGEIEVTFELDLNGLLQLSAVEVNTGEKVKAEFKSSRGRKIKKNVLDEMVLSTMDEAESTLVKRAEVLLGTAGLNPEDKEELNEWVEKFKKQQAEQDTEGLKKTENALLDLLYYLENQ